MKNRRSERSRTMQRFSIGILLMLAVSAGQSTRIGHSDRRLLGRWGDQGDGTYANPVLPADFSDIDAIRVADDYYAISSTLQYSPGMAVLHSKELVNWEVIGHVVDDLTRVDPELSWDKMNRRGRGIWAGSIRRHGGEYWVYFGTPDQGYFMSTAANPAGPWTRVNSVLRAAGWDDPCPFWDDDGQAYLVGTHFAPELPGGTSYNVHLFRMTSDGQHLVPGSDRTIHRSAGSEANKLYKINGFYYHLYSEVPREGRVIMMGRARTLLGPWETKQLIHVQPQVDKEPNQGGLLELPSRKWYFLSHQGTGDWEGRAVVLLAVTWMSGWPVIGRVGQDGIGNMVWGGEKAVEGFPRLSVAASDEFDTSKLKPNWEWNYQPRPGMWSLTARPGFLRLYAFQPLRAGFDGIGNILTQRSMRTTQSRVTAKLDLTGMVSGEQAGLAHFAKTFCSVSIVQTGLRRTVNFMTQGRTAVVAPVPRSTVWLRSTWNFAGVTDFWYSEDGVDFKRVGKPCQLTWAFYRGDRTGLFTYNANGARGYIDIDSFQYEIAR